MVTSTGNTTMPVTEPVVLTPNWVVKEDFMATPFYYCQKTWTGPPPPLARRPDKPFKTGEKVTVRTECDQTLSDDGYVVDLTKLSPAVMPTGTGTVGTGAAGTGSKPIIVESPKKKEGLFTMKNLIMVAIVLVLIYAFFKYVLPLIKKSVA